MTEKIRYPDRDTFSYQGALEMPSYTPPLPAVGEKKVSWGVYLFLEFIFFMLIFWKILFFIPLYWSGIFSILLAWYLADPIADLKIDGKFFHRYLFDKVVYWIFYRRKSQTHYISKGVLVKKRS